jgi:predicted nucleic acid-binding protein
MANYKIVLVDTDVISHFIATGNISRLAKIFEPNILFVLDVVYEEACRHPWDTDRKEKVDAWLSSIKSKPIEFPYHVENVKKEFYRIKKEDGLRDKGERACMAMAKYGKEVIASSNFSDIKTYCDANGIEYLGCLDILYIAMQKGLMTETECDGFISDAVVLNHARFPVSAMKDYVPDRDLTEWCRKA